VPAFQLLNLLNDVQETWYMDYAIGGRSNAAVFNFL
jgi:hypothetical protein